MTKKAPSGLTACTSHRERLRMPTCGRRQILRRGGQVTCTAEDLVSLTVLLLTVLSLTVLSLTDLLLIVLLPADLLLTVLSRIDLVASTVLSDVDNVLIRAAVN